MNTFQRVFIVFSICHIISVSVTATSKQPIATTDSSPEIIRVQLLLQELAQLVQKSRSSDDVYYRQTIEQIFTYVARMCQREYPDVAQALLMGAGDAHEKIVLDN